MPRVWRNFNISSKRIKINIVFRTRNPDLFKQESKPLHRKNSYRSSLLFYYAISTLMPDLNSTVNLSAYMESYIAWLENTDQDANIMEVRRQGVDMLRGFGILFHSLAPSFFSSNLAVTSYRRSGRRGISRSLMLLDARCL